MFFKELACFILFSYQCSFMLFVVVFICLCFATTHLGYHVFQTLSTTFFKIFKKVFFKNFNAERGIWTLAPVARPTPLAGAPLQPLEYFCWTLWFYITLISQCNGYYKWEFFVCQQLFLKFFITFFRYFLHISNIFNLLYSLFIINSISCIYTSIIIEEKFF